VKRILWSLCFILAASASAAHLQAASPIIKMGTLVPEGSAWHVILKEMGEKWKASGVELRLYAGGILGDEKDVIRKMRIGQVQGGIMTVVGLAEIDKSVMALAMPMMYASDDELDYVREKMRTHLEQRFAAKGFVILNWGDAGWVTFFGKKPILTPDDLKAHKFFIWAGDNDSLNIWKSAGYNPIPLAPTDILTGLQTGLIDSFDTTPISALSFQWFKSAPYMTDLKWAPLLGATVVTKKAWDALTKEQRTALEKASLDAGAALRKDIRSKEKDVMDVMKKYGLVVETLTPDQKAQWAQVFQASYPTLIGKLVPADSFNEAKKYRDEYRAKKH
jgi:TRAP-type C4-dicarboxylate transport system substrate-binding protein